MYYVQQMNNGRWYVLRTANDGLPRLLCEDGSWETKPMAVKALSNELAKLLKEKE